MTDSATQLPHGGKQPFSGKLVIAVVSLAILTFLGILSITPEILRKLVEGLR